MRCLSMLLVLWLLLPQVGSAFSIIQPVSGGPVTLDTAGSQDSGTDTTTSFTLALTVANQPNRFIACYLGMQSAADDTANITVDWNGTDLTKQSVVQVSTVANLSLWTDTAPDTGSHLVTVTSVSAYRMVIGCFVVYNVNQSTPLDTPQTGSGTQSTTDDLSLTVSSASGDYVISACMKRNSTGSVTEVGDGTEQWNDQTTSATTYENVIVSGVSAAGAASVVPDYDLGAANWPWVHIAVNINKG